MSERPTVSADPCIQFGRPCIAGTRIPAESVAEQVAAGELVDCVAEIFNLTRPQVLVACWYYARHGAGDGLGLRTQLRDAWASWAAEHQRAFGTEDYDAIPDPEAVGRPGR